MKSCVWLFALLCLVVSVHAQTINIKSFSVKHELPGDVSTWGPDAANAVAASTNLQGGSKEVRLVISIKKGGSYVCGNDRHSTSYENITTKVITTRDIAAMLGNCVLNPGQYSLCLEFIAIDGRTLSGEICREFTVPTPEIQQPGTSSSTQGVSNNISEPRTSINTPVQEPVRTYRRPDLVSPMDNNSFKVEEFKKPLTFRWTPVIPPPPANKVAYTIRIYEVQQGQQALQAAKQNQPIYEKETKTTQTIWQLPSEYLRGDENKTFVWNVQALDNDGKPYGENNGISETWKFMMSGTTCNTEIKILQFDCPDVSGKYNFKIKVTNNDNINRKIETIEIVEVNNVSVSAVGANVPFTPNSIIVGPSSSQTVTGSFSYAGTAIKCVKIHVNLGDGTSSSYTDCNMVDTICISCKCTYCDDKKMTVINDSVSVINNSASGYDELELNADLKYGTQSGGVVPVYRITAEIVAFEHTINHILCTTCNTENEMHGVFINPNNNTISIAAPWINNGKANLYPSGSNFSRQADWSNSLGVNMVSTARHLKLRIGIPEQNKLQCCSDKIRFAVRYSFTSKDATGACRVCEIIKTYCRVRKGNICPSPSTCNGPVPSGDDSVINDK